MQWCHIHKSKERKFKSKDSATSVGKLIEQIYLKTLYTVCGMLWVVKEVVEPKHYDWLASLSGCLQAVQAEHLLEPLGMSSK